MKNTTKFVLSIGIITAAAMVSNTFTTDADGNVSAAPTARTGSPADGANCTSCHSGTAVTLPGLITSDIPATGYVPGQVYTITASVTQAGKTKFGFEISPQTATGVKKGTMTVTSATTTQLITAGKYITHKSAGTSFPSGTATWSFNWTAPVAGSGNFLFYGAFNVSNNNNASSGDAIKLSTLAVQEDVSAGIEELHSIADEINVFPNPAEDQLNIMSTATPGELMNVSIINMQGKQVRRMEEQTFGSVLDISDLAAGYYVLRIDTEKGFAVKKFIKK